VREHQPHSRVGVLVIDDLEGSIDPATEPFEVLSPADLDCPAWDRMAARYDQIELATAIKPWLMRHLLARAPSVVYLDPDIRLYGPLEPVEAALNDHGIVLSPHNIAPIPRDGRRPTEADILVAGAYNLGFLGLSRRPDAERLLGWWSERLETECVVDPARGRFVDQRWLDLAPAMLPGVHLLRDEGCNVAYWNLPSRRLAPDSSNGGMLTVNGGPLRFFHFSGFDPERPHLLSRFQDRVKLSEDAVLRDLCREYARELLDQGYGDVISREYGLGRTPSGLELGPVLRAEVGRALDAGALTRSIFVPEGERELVAWLTGPAEVGGHAGINRYCHALYRARPDVQVAYPDLGGKDGAGFLGWCGYFGTTEAGLRSDLLPEASRAHVPGPAGDPPAELPATVGVNVTGYLQSELGIGEVARQAAAALEAAGVPTRPVGLVAPGSRQGHGHAHVPPEANDFPVNLICVNADGMPDFRRQVGPEFFEGRHSIGWWWWEVSRFPEVWLSSFEVLDEVWAGSRFVADILAEVSPVPVVKLTTPVSLPPRTRPDREGLGLPDDFLFLFMFDYHSVAKRKNPLGLVDAFTSAFPPDAGATLVLKSINHQHYPDEHERVRVAVADHPHVRLFEGYLGAHDKNNLLASCDCYVSLHRSEGFGITMAEAMYLGKPVVATSYGGNLEFMTPANSYLVDHRLVPIGSDAGPYPPDADWADPDLEHAARLMRGVVERPDEAADRGRRAAVELRAGHSPAAAGTLMRRRLERVAGRRAAVAVPADVGAPAPPDTSEARDLLATGPRRGSRSPAGPLGTLARRVVLRLMRPFTAYERQVDEHLLRAVEALGATVAGLAEQAAGRDRRAAAARSELLLQMRRLAPERLDGVAKDVEDVLQRAAELERRIEEADRCGREADAPPYMAARPFHSRTLPGLGTVYGYETEAPETPAPTDRYRGFEDVFRGTEDFVRDRQRTYLALLGGRQPVFDLGCGRGEFLDLLRGAGLEYTGVDLDPGMVERCREKGHTAVVVGDGVELLADLPPAGLGAIFSAQVAEHLSYPALCRLLELGRTRLAPDGLLVIETVNPHSAPALKAFWVDPTHRHPLFPEALLALCRLSGYGSAYVFHPHGSGDVTVDRRDQGEYALVATPAAGPVVPEPRSTAVQASRL
jgi:SAM-dependent methyltransferase